MEWTQSPCHSIVAFDIDGTLVNLSGASSRALRDALRAVVGSDVNQLDLAFAGMTDRGIVLDVLERLGQTRPPPTDQSSHEKVFQAVIRRYLEVLPEAMVQRPYRPTPGARELIQHLSTLPGLRLGLATGNVEAAAWDKLRSVALDQYFSFGAFGDVTKRRDNLVRQALNLGRGDSRGPQPSSFVVGDTPADIRAALAAGAAAVAVATGPYSMEALSAESPTWLFPDLRAAAKQEFWLSPDK
jgi:phosphoglycolate phosphatase